MAFNPPSPNESRPPLPPETRKMKIREIMSSPVRTIPDTASAMTAAEQMQQHRLQHLVVIDDRGHVAGVISDRDIQAAQPSRLLVRDQEMRSKALGVIKVRDLMAGKPHVARATDPVEGVLKEMLHYRIGCVPVVDRAGVPVGIVTGGDVVHLALRLMGSR